MAEFPNGTPRLSWMIEGIERAITDTPPTEKKARAHYDHAKSLLAEARKAEQKDDNIGAIAKMFFAMGVITGAELADLKEIVEQIGLAI